MTHEQTLLTIEYTAVALNILYILFAAKEKRICWVFGGVASLISVYLFYHGNLISEAQLYFFYFIMAIYGWIAWGKSKLERPIQELPLKKHLGILVLGGLLTIVFYQIALSTGKAEYIYLDALTTSFSILATFLTIRKILSSWIYWILIDILSTYMYCTKGYDIYALQMVGFTVLAAVAFYQWNKTYKNKNTLNEA